MDRAKLLRDFGASYRRACQNLGEKGLQALLTESAKRWSLASVLKQGGSLTFPHVHLADCGQQVGAVINACLDSGLKRVLVLSVLHPFTDEMEEARLRVAKGGDPRKEPLRGVFGEGCSNPEGVSTWWDDHALYCFRQLWRAALKQRGIEGPELVMRYIHLTGSQPETLPGIDDLARLAKDAAVVSTGDHVHHGLGYGNPPEEVQQNDEEGRKVICALMEEGFNFLSAKDYGGYINHCLTKTKSDWRDVGPVLQHLRGPLKHRVVDFRSSDFSGPEVYGAPPPTWVASALVAWE